MERLKSPTSERRGPFQDGSSGGGTTVDLSLLICGRSGIIQVVFSPDVSKEAHELAHALRSEYVIKIRGEVRRRP